MRKAENQTLKMESHTEPLVPSTELKDLYEDELETDSMQRNEKNVELRAYHIKESKHLNSKLLFSFSMIFILFLCSWLRGNGKDPSIIGVTKC